MTADKVAKDIIEAAIKVHLAQLNLFLLPLAFLAFHSYPARREISFGTTHMLCLRVFLWLSLSCLCTLAAGQTSDAVQEQSRARELVTDGKPLEAIPIYEELLRGSPDNPTLLVNLAVAHFKAGQYEATIPVCRDALRANPQLAAAWLFLGASYFQLQQPANAIEPLARVIELQPTERNARLMLGESLLATNRFAEAASHLEEASKLIPESPRAWYGLERSYSALAKEADSELESRVRDSAWWHALTGDAALRRQRYGLALSHYREALQQQPDIPGVHTSIASIYRATEHGEWASVEGQFETQHACGEQTPGCAFRNGKYAECLKFAGASNSAESLYWRAKAYRQLAAAASSNLAALPPSSQIHELRARDLDVSARHREAAIEWRTALEIAGGGPSLERGLALSLMNARDHAAALPLLEKLLQSQPDSAEIHFLCGAAYMARERLDLAIPHLRRATELDPGSADAQGALGEALLKTATYEDAIPALKASLTQDKEGVRHFQLSQAYRETGQIDLATQTLKEYKRLAAEREAVRKELEREYPITPPCAAPRAP